MERSVEIVVTGGVQGVAFRWHASLEAERLGIAGWVRNEPDGTVRCRAQGPAAAVDRFTDWCRHGPRWASVDRISITDVEPGPYRSFEIIG